MNRRHFLSQISMGSALAGLGGCSVAQAQERAARGSAPIKIKKVRAFLTAPAKIRLVVVRVETSEPGFTGLGCAPFTQRARLVAQALHQILAPLLRDTRT